MIEINEIFSEGDKRFALWCEEVADTNDLAMMAESVIRENIGLVSVPPETVPFVWACLEKAKVKILTRFDFNPIQKNVDDDICNLSADVSSVCKKGANGVQVFVKMRDFERFIDAVSVIRDDLFFEHDLSIGIDVSDLDMADLDGFFKKLRDIRANSLVLTLKEDMGNRSDFVGRVYGLLKNWDFDGELHFVLNGDNDRIDQVIRLAECEKPEISEKLRFFFNY